MVVRKVGKYEIGRTVGEGTFAKVKFAQNTETGESVAMKILDRNTILKHKMIEQIKQEISIMKLVRHPHVVRLHEVLASRTKIYIILEYVTGGELFDKIVHHGRLSELEARKYFQQLIDGVECCHSKGVYHRDLKPENLLLDSQGNIKISDFGLSAKPPEGVSVLKTTCGTPNYVAPEVLDHKGYNGALADIWSCGVILYIANADYSFPSWFSMGAKSLIKRILDPNPQSRIRMEDIKNDEWFNKEYIPARFVEYEDVNLDDLNAVFDETEDQQDNQHHGNDEDGPLMLNAFDLIILSQGLNLQSLFDKSKDSVKQQTRFVSQKPAKVVLSSMEVVAQSMGFKTHIRNYKMRIEGLSTNKTGNITVILEVFEVAPTFLLVDIQKAAGDLNEYLNFYKNFCENLDDIIWKPPNDSGLSKIGKNKTRKRP
ncbi:CBL-interacting serine/threonine-protein kinase 8 [Bienertia sinuspersici]